MCNKILKYGQSKNEFYRDDADTADVDDNRTRRHSRCRAPELRTAPPADGCLPASED